MVDGGEDDRLDRAGRRRPGPLLAGLDVQDHHVILTVVAVVHDQLAGVREANQVHGGAQARRQRGHQARRTQVEGGQHAIAAVVADRERPLGVQHRQVGLGAVGQATDLDQAPESPPSPAPEPGGPVRPTTPWPVIAIACLVGVVAVVHEQDLAAVDHRVPPEALVRRRAIGRGPTGIGRQLTRQRGPRRSAARSRSPGRARPGRRRTAGPPRPRPGTRARRGPPGSPGRGPRRSTRSGPRDRSLVTTVPSSRTTKELYARSTGSSRDATTCRSGSRRWAHRP